MEVEDTDSFKIEPREASPVKESVPSHFLNLFRSSTRSATSPQPPPPNYFSNTFHKATCTLYIANEHSPYRLPDDEFAPCQCGQAHSQHTEAAIAGNNASETSEWDSSLVETAPTDTFGVIHFPATSETPRGICQFARIWAGDNPEDVVTLMKDQWDILPSGRESVCITFIGALSAPPSIPLIETLESALLALATRTSIVIFIHGEDTPLSRAVGEIVKKVMIRLSFIDPLAPPPALIGFISWTHLRDNELLVGEFKDVVYAVCSQPTARELDSLVGICPYLTHTLFIDSGRRSPEQFCSSFMQHVTLSLIDSEKTYALQFLWEGDANDLGSLNDERYPLSVIVFRNSGGLAKVFAEGNDFAQAGGLTDEGFSQENQRKIQISLEELQLTSEDIQQTLDVMVKVLVDSNNRFQNFNERSETSRLFYDICDACKETLHDRDQFISFNISFGEPSLLKKLFCQLEEDDIDRDFLYQKLLAIFMTNRPSFLNAFMQLGLHLEDRLTLGDLHDLYNNSPGSKSLVTLLLRKHVISDMEETISIAPKAAQRPATDDGDARTPTQTPAPDTAEPVPLQRFIHPITTSKKKKITTKIVIYLNDVERFLHKIFFKVNLTNYNLDVPAFSEDSRKFTMPNPFWHLFIWAVLMGYNELALKILKSCDSSTSMAVMASTYYRYVIKTVPHYDTETRSLYENAAILFESYASDVISGMEDVNQEHALSLLAEDQPIIGQRKLLDIALFGRNTKFVSQAACQEYTQREWTAGIRSNAAVIVSSVFLPFLLHFDSINQWGPGVDGISSLSTMNLWQRIKTFYSSTAVKYFIFYLQFLIFLLLIAYSILFDLPFEHLGVAEAIGVAFYAVTSVSTALDFILEMLESGPKKAYLIFYSGSFQMIIQLSYLVTWIYIVIRETEVGGIEGLRTFLAIFLLVTSLRILDGLQFYRSFGPLIVLLKSIFPIYLLFLLIIAIVLVPYGIAIQVILSPQSTYDSFGSFLAIFSRPFYNLFGEVGNEEVTTGPAGCAEDASRFECIAAYVIHFGYMCFAAILVLNLIIAIFSDAYLRYNAIAQDLWKNVRLSIAEDYRRKSAVPQPFAVFSQLKKLILKLVEKVGRQHQTSENAAEVQGSGGGTEESVARLERACLKSVFRNRRQEKLATVEASLSATKTRLSREMETYSRLYEPKWHSWIDEEAKREKAEKEQRLKNLASVLGKRISKAATDNAPEDGPDYDELLKSISDGVSRLEILKLQVDGLQQL